MNYNLFLDDFRYPKDCFDYTWNPIYNKEKWIIVRNYNDFIYIIETFEMPNIISFDHDLDEEHYIQQTNIDYNKFTEKTGYDCAKWLIDYIINNELKPPKQVLIHSMNLIGNENIRKLFENFNKNYLNK